ncbi:MAG: SDR family NAD(P)-dependent oxidoreductase [Planctomycetota bacterium]|nr:SDR family NAD(P)-dependent oxidoreductase [Planctomycetota bacterium]
MHPKGKNIWITGASSGLGRALALELAARGAALLLSARRREHLEDTARLCRDRGGRAEILALDLAQTESLAAAAAVAEKRLSGIHMLVNAGGIGQRGSALETGLPVARRIFDIDFWAPVELTRAVLPAMIRRNSGQIVVVTSVQGKFGMAHRSCYAAAKHALHGWFESLREELSGTNVETTLLVPGWARTEISRHALEADGKPHGADDPGQLGGLSPEEFAERSLPAIARGKPEQLIGGVECAGVYLNRLSPRLFRLALRLRERKTAKKAGADKSGHSGNAPA